MRTLLTALIALAAGAAAAAAPTKIDALQLGGAANGGGFSITNAADVVTVSGRSLTGSAARAEAAMASATNKVASRAGNAWPRTFKASGFNYYDYGASAGGGSLCSIAYGFDAFPRGMYTNVARLAVQIRWTTNAACTRYYATNFVIRITGAGPNGPAGGAYVLWSSACDWCPTNSGTWVFSDSGGVGSCSTTGTIVNKTAPTYDTYSAVHVPFIYLINNGANPVTNATCSYVIEYDNGAAD